MADTPKSLPFTQRPIKDLEEMKQAFAEFVKVQDEMHRLRSADIDAIEKRLTDGGL